LHFFDKFVYAILKNYCVFSIRTFDNYKNKNGFAGSDNYSKSLLESLVNNFMHDEIVLNAKLFLLSHDRNGITTLTFKSKTVLLAENYV